MQPQENKKQAPYRLFLIIATSTTILLVSPVLVLLAFGYFIDSFFHTTPLYMFVGIGIGFIGGVVNVFRMVQMMQNKKVRKQSTGSNDTLQSGK